MSIELDTSNDYALDKCAYALKYTADWLDQELHGNPYRKHTHRQSLLDSCNVALRAIKKLKGDTQ